MDFDVNVLPWIPDVIWASPPCETFSVASISHHWNYENKTHVPKSEKCIEGINRVKKTLEIIQILKPKYFIIENPRGILRKMIFMANLNRYTVTYCQYGEHRMKPTDLWSNIPDLVFRPVCKNGEPCHERAPRGAKTGTQGIKGYKDRSIVPKELCLDVYQQIQKRLNNE